MLTKLKISVYGCRRRKGAGAANLPNLTPHFHSDEDC
jgi:hypothetical protein